LAYISFITPTHGVLIEMPILTINPTLVSGKLMHGMKQDHARIFPGTGVGLVVIKF
jgi:hypothetical protein